MSGERAENPGSGIEEGESVTSTRRRLSLEAISTDGE
jgi:hypothetical protein